jgi:hypothetical protein
MNKMYIGDLDIAKHVKRQERWDNIVLWIKRTLVALGLLAVLWAVSALFLCM